MLVLVRLATCATAEFGRPRHHRNVTVRVVPPPRRLAARGVDPPRQRAGGWSPRCRRSEQETSYAIALPPKGRGGYDISVSKRRSPLIPPSPHRGEGANRRASLTHGSRHAETC